MAAKRIFRGITDMHCHVLPDVDDGPKNLRETEELLRCAEKQGISTMIVTPHYHPGKYLVTADVIQNRLAVVKRLAIEKSIRVNLLAGQECFWFSGLLDALNRHEVLTLNNTKYVLVEFMPWTLYGEIREAVSALQSEGYYPIIAHFERYECLQKREDRLVELKREGAFLQLNFDRLLDHDSFLHRNPWLKLLDEGYVDFLGSDTHGMKFRPIHVEEALAKASQKVDSEVLDRILGTNIGFLKGL